MRKRGMHVNPVLDALERGGYDPSLQAAYQRHEEFKATVPTPIRPQKWGDAVALFNLGSQTALVSNSAIMPEQIFVDIALPEPRMVYLDTDVQPRFTGASITGRPTYVYRLVIGIGDASIVEETTVLPEVVYCQTLQVYARRNVLAFVGEVQFRKFIWAALAQGNDTPQPFAYESVTLGIGVALLDINPPFWTTHIQAAASPGETAQEASLQIQPPLQSGAAVFQTPLLWFGAANTTGTLPIPVMVPRNMAEYQFRRAATTAAATYTLMYCK